MDTRPGTAGCVCAPVSPFSEGMAAAGAAWAELRNDGYGFHGTELSNRGNRLNLLEQISRKAGKANVVPACV